MPKKNPMAYLQELHPTVAQHKASKRYNPAVVWRRWKMGTLKLMAAKFKPCPFCGGTHIEVNPTEFLMNIRCVSCGANRNCVTNHAKQVVAEWNTRAPISVPRVA